jgi:hypothetical protein
MIPLLLVDWEWRYKGKLQENGKLKGVHLERPL